MDGHWAKCVKKMESQIFNVLRISKAAKRDCHSRENAPNNRQGSFHRRKRIKTEEKAKVVSSVWGQNLFISLQR